MAIQRIVDTSPHDDAEEQRIEVSLRPQSFSEYVGQERLKRQRSAASRWIMCCSTVRRDWARPPWRR